MRSRKSFSLWKGLLFTFLWTISLGLFAQNITVTGTVTDDTGMTVIGATVIVGDDTSHGTVTDIDGNYVLNNVPKDSKLVFSYVGFKTQSIAVNGRASIDVLMSSDTELLDEVVVVGFGTQKKVNLTGAVSTLDSKELESRPVSSVAQALQGVLPGLNISAPNLGGIDSAPSINIRGVGNLNTGSNSSPLILIDGVEGDINSLNPQDIENISVLKDAAAASIYGSRAPFGVVLVTTKSGAKGKAKIQYSDNFRWSNPTHINDMLDSYRFAQYFNRGWLNTGGSKQFEYDENTMDRIKGFIDGTITDVADPSLTQGGQFYVFNLQSNDNQNWPRNYFDKTSFGQEHNIAVNGGSDNVNYYISGAFLTHDGKINYADERKNRYNISGKVSGQVLPWLRLDFNSRFIREDFEQPTFLDLYGERFFQETTKLFPTMPLYDPNGNFTRNPKLMQLADGGRANKTTDTYFTQGGFTIEPIENLSITGNAALRTQNYQHQYGISKVYLYNKENEPVLEQWLGGDPDLDAGKTLVQSENISSSMLTTSLLADYEFSINEAHNFKVMVGMNSEYFSNNYLMANRKDLIDDNVPSINTATGISSNQGTMGEWATLGFFGRLNYNYLGKYLAEVNIRKDGTSRFRGDNRWATFPSFSLGWNIGREEIWEPISDLVGTFKPRFSYGSLGNQNTNSWYPTYSIQNITVGSPDQGGRWLTTPDSRSNVAWAPGLISDALTWERITSYNYGLDIGMFKNRLNGSFDYFIRNTDDMVGPAEEISPIIGAGAPAVNNTSIQTSGWELQIDWRDRIGAVNYNVMFNVSDSRTKVTKYPNPGRNLANYYEGQVLGEIWGYVTHGMAKTDQEMSDWLLKHDQDKLAGGSKIWKAGDMMYENLDDDPAITPGENTVDNPGDRKVIGNSTPRYRFGLRLGADWKGIDMSVFFQGVAKRDVAMGGMIFWGITPSGTWNSTGYEDHWDFFRPEGDELGGNVNSYYPRPIMNSGQNQHTQTKYLQSAAYIRLKNIQLGYTLPQSMTEKVSINKVRLFFSGENLLTGTKLNKNFDPEVLYNNGMSYPLDRTFSCGVNVVF